METIKCAKCGCIMGAASEKCPVCGTVVKINEETIVKESPQQNVSEKFPNQQLNKKNAIPAEIEKKIVGNTDAETHPMFSAGKEDGINYIKKYAIAVVFLIAIVCCGYWLFMRPQKKAIALTSTTVESLQNAQEQNITQVNSYAEKTANEMGGTFNETKDNVIINVDSLKEDSLKENDNETNKAKVQGPEWIQGTWIYTFPEGEKADLYDYEYCKVIIDGNNLTIVEKLFAYDDIFEFQGKWKYKDEGNGYKIYYYDNGGKGVEIDFDKELLILPKNKYINGIRIIYYMHKINE